MNFVLFIAWVASCFACFILGRIITIIKPVDEDTTSVRRAPRGPGSDDLLKGYLDLIKKREEEIASLRMQIKRYEDILG